MMDCQSARRILSDIHSPSAPNMQVSEALEHRRHCGPCQAWEESERAWREALREKISSHDTPVAVKERVLTAVARARAEVELKRQRRWWRTVVAALVLLGGSLGLFWWWREPSRSDTLAVSLAESHLLYASHPAPVEFASDNPPSLQDWLAHRVDFAVKVPPLNGAVLLGGRLCTLGDRRVAMVIYQSGERRLSLFQMPNRGLALAPMRQMTVQGRNYRCGHHKGVEVVTWQDRGVLFALASDLPEEDLLRLTRF